MKYIILAMSLLLGACGAVVDFPERGDGGAAKSEAAAGGAADNGGGEAAK